MADTRSSPGYSLPFLTRESPHLQRRNLDRPREKSPPTPYSPRPFMGGVLQPDTFFGPKTGSVTP